MGKVIRGLNPHITKKQVKSFKGGELLKIVNAQENAQLYKEGVIVEFREILIANLITVAIVSGVVHKNFIGRIQSLFYWRFQLVNKDWFDIWVR